MSFRLLGDVEERDETTGLGVILAEEWGQRCFVGTGIPVPRGRLQKKKPFPTLKALNAHIRQVHPSDEAVSPEDEAAMSLLLRTVLEQATYVGRPAAVIAVRVALEDNDELVVEERASAIGQSSAIVREEDTRVKKKTRGSDNRRTFTLQKKIEVIRAFDASFKLLNERAVNFAIPQNVRSETRMCSAKQVRLSLSKKINVPETTIFKFLADRKRLMFEYETRCAIKSGGIRRLSKHAKRIGNPGRRAVFRVTEARLATYIRDLRQEQKIFPTARVLVKYREFAEEEARVAGLDSTLFKSFQTMKFSSKLCSAFLHRNRLSSRVMTCMKAKTLSEMIRQARGWYRHLLAVFSDEGNFFKGMLDPVFGRFLLAQRINKDEVPCPFGMVGKIINDMDLKATHVVLPAGFGDRIATLDLAVSALGYLLKVMIIFHGTGKRVETYAENDEVHVTWQKKAWKDGPREIEWYRKILLPYKQALDAKLGHKCEMLVQHDNVKMHHDYNALQYAFQHVDVLSLNPPPDSTPYLQPIDDSIGQRFRADVVEVIMEAIDVRTEPWTLPEKRKLVFEATQASVRLWRTDPRRVEMIKGSVKRCGLDLTVGGRVPKGRAVGNVDPTTIAAVDNSKFRPVRFPVDFANSVFDPLHAEYNDFVPFQAHLPRGTMRFDSANPLQPLPEKQKRKVAKKAFAAAPSGKGKDDAVDRDEEDEEEGDSEEEADIMAQFGPTWASDWEQEFVETSEFDDSDNVLQLTEHNARRGCLPGCECETKEYRRGCMCFSKFGFCLPSCDCACSREKLDAPLERESSFVSIDAAIATNEGEDVVHEVMSHEEEDGALYFQVRWESLDVSEEPFENLMDKDGAINKAVLEYAKACSPPLLLDPYIKVMLRILNGLPDKASNSDEELEEDDL